MIIPFYVNLARAFLEDCLFSDKPPLASADGTCNTASRSSQHVHVLVTSGSLIPSLVKCLLFRLNDLITPENGESPPLLFWLFSSAIFSGPISSQLPLSLSPIGELV